MNKINHIRKAPLNPPQVGRFPSPFGGVGGGFLFLLLCGSLFLLSGCDWDELSGNGKEPPIEMGKPVPVSFTISEAGFGNNEVVTRKAEATSGRVGHASIRIADDLYMYATVDEEEASVMLRAKVNLTPGTKVRIVAYAGTGYTTNVGYADYEVTSGMNLTPYPTGAPDLSVPSGSTKFVAYSFGSTSAMPSFAETTAAITSQDVMWGESTVNVGGGSAAVHITMEHKQTKVVMNAVTVNSGGTSDALNSVDAEIFCYAPTLTVQSGVINKAGSPSGRPFVWSSLNPVLSSQTSDIMYVFTDSDNPTCLIINSMSINGTTYTGPWHINYTKPLEAGKSYVLYVRFEREPAGGSVPRITWQPLDPATHPYPYGRYIITYDPRDAGLYFKFGSVVGIYSADGKTQTLPVPSSSPAVPPFLASRDIPWDPAGTITNWSSVPVYTRPGDPDVLKITPADNYHTIANVKAGKGDPCRLAGLDLNKISTGSLNYSDIDNGIWRLPTLQENFDFSGYTGYHSYGSTAPFWWNKNQSGSISYGVAGGEFPTRNQSGLSKFLPAAGIRDFTNGAVSLQEEWGYFWSNEVDYLTGYYIPEIAATTIGPFSWVFSSNHLSLIFGIHENMGIPVRCVRQTVSPYDFEVSVEGWIPGGSLGTSGGEGDVNL